LEKVVAVALEASGSMGVPRVALGPQGEEVLIILETRQCMDQGIVVVPTLVLDLQTLFLEPPVGQKPPL
jgi:hypothetical protein